MAQYKSEQVTLQGNADTVYKKLNDLNALRTLLDKLPGDSIPDEQKKMFENITISDDSITIPTGAGPMGQVTLKKEGCVEPVLVRLVGEGTPVPLALILHIEPLSDSESVGVVEVDIDVPMLVKPMIAGPMNKLVTQIAQFLPAVKFNQE